MEGSFHGRLLGLFYGGVISWRVAKAYFMEGSFHGRLLRPILWRGHFIEGC